MEDAAQLERMYARGQQPVVSMYSEAELLAPRTSIGNVIIELTGSELPDEVVVIGGHIDSWGEQCALRADSAEGAPGTLTQQPSLAQRFCFASPPRLLQILLKARLTTVEVSWRLGPRCACSNN
jgi:hypothetical protein